MKNYNVIRESISAASERSAWRRGVKLYALELLDGLEEAIEGGYFSDDDMIAPHLLERAMLNGARDWYEYSWGGCALIYNRQIAERLCTPYELKRTKYGASRPNCREDWHDVQSRALHQAAYLIKEAAKALRVQEV